MKKLLVIIPLILALYTVVETAVDSAFETEAITINTEFFKKSPSRTDLVKTSKASPVKEEAKHLDVSGLDFSNPSIDIKKNVEKIEKKVINRLQIVKKSVESFELDKKEINIVKTKTRKIKKNIIELDINEKVEVYAYTKIKEIKKTNWSAILEYSPAKIEVIEEVEPEQVIVPVLAKKRAKQIKEKYFENLATPITRKNAQKVKKEKIVNIKKEADRISTKLAATEKSNAYNNQSDSKISNNDRELKVYANDGAKQEELVFFDYAAAGNDLNTQKVAKTKIEKPKSSVIVATKSIEKPKLDFNNIGGVKKSGGPIEPQVPKVTTHSPDTVNLAKKYMSTQASTTQVEKPIVDKKNYRSDYSVQPYNVNGNRKFSDVSQFEIRFDDDIDDIVQSFGEGQINLKILINTPMSIRRGTIYSAAHYPTTVDFVLEDNEIVAKIPMFEKEYLNNVITKAGVTGFGGQVVVELDNHTEDVDIDTKYEHKIFLDKYLRVVDRADSDYSFIMFLGVDTGNAIISFKTVENKTVSKIIHISEDEIYYEPNFYVDISKDSFELNEEYLLTKDEGPLSIDPKSLEGLTFGNEFKKRTSNIYGVNKVKYPVGTRSYVELKHLNESIYIGRWKNARVTVPSEQYMRHVLDNFKIDGVGSNCLVQINLPKQAKELYFNGQSKSGAMRMQVRILDEDGIFYTDLSNESEKIFLLGEEQGIINVKVRYVDGSSDYLQSYCSDNTYLVEQL